MSKGITIACSQCTLEHSSACDDCVVSFLLDRDPNEAIVIEASELRAVRLLGAAGLVPDLRHERRAG